jgi:hypothetical protein
MSKLEEIADCAQHHDFAAEMGQGSWEVGTDADPMVTVRPPRRSGHAATELRRKGPREGDPSQGSGGVRARAVGRLGRRRRRRGSTGSLGSG